MESANRGSPVELTTPRRPRSSKIESPRLESGRKRVRKASLVWETLEKDNRSGPASSNMKMDLSAELSPIMFNDIEQELSNKSGELNAKLEKSRNLYNASSYSVGCDNKMQLGAEDAVQESSMANEQLILESILKEPVAFVWGNNEREEVASLVEMPPQSCGASAKEEAADIYVSGGWKDGAAGEDEVCAYAKDAAENAKEESVAMFSDLNLNFDYMPMSDRGAFGGSEKVMHGGESCRWNCVEDSFEIKRLESTVAALRRELDLRNVEIKSLRDKNDESEMSNKKKYEQICLMKNIIRALKQDLMFMHEKYRAEKNSTEAFDHEESELLLERAKALAETLRRIYDEETSRLRSEYDASARKNREVCAELAGYKKIVKELVTRIRKEKSAADLVYDLRKDLG